MEQNYNETAGTDISTKARTVQRFSQRLLFILAPSVGNTPEFSRDVSKAYVQTNSRIEREVYIEGPVELLMWTDIGLRVMKTLYGIP